MARICSLLGWQEDNEGYCIVPRGAQYKISYHDGIHTITIIPSTNPTARLRIKTVKSVELDTKNLNNAVPEIKLYSSPKPDQYYELDMYVWGDHRVAIVDYDDKELVKIILSD